MTTRAVGPEGVLVDGANFAEFGGRNIRKGTVAAFVANARALAGCAAGSEEHAELLSALTELAPDLAALGLFEVFSPRDPEVAELVSAMSFD